MTCTNHPYKNNTPGGICAFCLQEKLGKLVSSSFPITVFPSSSSSSPSFRSHHNFTTTTTTTSNTIPSSLLSNTQQECHHNHNFKISKFPFFLTHKKKKKKDSYSDMENHNNNNAMIFKRSKSTVTPRKEVHFAEFEDFSSHKKRFFSFRHLNKQVVSKKVPEIKHISYPSSRSTNMGLSSTSRERSLKKENAVVVEENDSPDQVSLDRKVSRSRSVGCGSRSFSGEFFERISTGFGDCSTLRRVESQREGKSSTRRSSGAGHQNSIKERVKCGGLFSGFMVTSSSSSSSSSSYWVSSSNEDNNSTINTKAPATVKVAHGRSKSWGWAFASPMRAFSKPARRDGSKNVGPNLGAIPSLLAARS